jgi:hypothetical protein
MECKICGKAKRIAARGMCGACYIRERRKAERGDAYIGRRPTGYHEVEAMRYASEWGKLFASKVDRSGDCHTWRGTLSKIGYGHFSFGGRTYLAHRLAFLLAGGDSGMPVVMHACDNPSCVNPAHLAGGTHVENMADMDGKGRRNVTPKCGAHLRDRQSHPRAKPISTPIGVFPSLSLAADAHGVPASTMKSWLARSKDGFSRC